MKSDVWELQSNDQEMASEDLNFIAERALRGYRGSQNYLKKLWPECSWKTIKERLNTEGSTWYVWWMDGVNQHLKNMFTD